MSKKSNNQDTKGKVSKIALIAITAITLAGGTLGVLSSAPVSGNKVEVASVKQAGSF